MKISEVSSSISKIKSNIEKVIIGKPEKIEIILAAFFAGGHVLLEDVPGTGKTMLAKALAKSFDLEFSRIQFTPDLLPSDLTGINFYNPKTGDFTLKKGAVFTNILLGDEINRATPRTQSALLESMEERQITIDDKSYILPPPFFVIATQNPVETQGTFPLPEAQLDRFLIKLSLGYPTKEELSSILTRGENPLEKLESVCTSQIFSEVTSAIKDVFVHKEIANYIVEIAEKTRKHEYISLGVSTRGAISLLNISKAHAAINGRSFVIPDDIQFLAPYVFSHRMIYKGGYKSESIVQEIIDTTKPPVEKWDKLL